jgi:hypothetical protein
MARISSKGGQLTPVLMLVPTPVGNRPVQFEYKRESTRLITTGLEILIMVTEDQLRLSKVRIIEQDSLWSESRVGLHQLIGLLMAVLLKSQSLRMAAGEPPYGIRPTILAARRLQDSIDLDFLMLTQMSPAEHSDRRNLNSFGRMAPYRGREDN